MFHVYTFGRESKQFLILTPKQAETINFFTDRFFEAQEHFLEKHGRRWTPDEPIEFLMNDSRRKKLDQYNKLVPKLNFQHKIRNRVFSTLRINVSTEDLDDYLVKRF